MTTQQGIPKGAAVAINELLEHCAKIQPGQEVVLLAHTDGLYGGDNLVDERAISWIQAAIHQRVLMPRFSELMNKQSLTPGDSLLLSRPP